MQVKLVDSTTDAAFNISYAARTCYNSHDKDDLKKRDGFFARSDIRFSNDEVTASIY